MNAAAPGLPRALGRARRAAHVTDPGQRRNERALAGAPRGPVRFVNALSVPANVPALHLHVTTPGRQESHRHRDADPRAMRAPHRPAGPRDRATLWFAPGQGRHGLRQA